MNTQRKERSISDYPNIGKTVPLDPNDVKTPAVLRLAFYDRAIHNGWTTDELQQVKDFLVGKPFAEQLDIIEYYCESSELNRVVTETCLEEDVQFLLSYLQKETHYLFEKPIATWDSFDWNNYWSLEKQATTRLVRKYALYDKDVNEKDKYVVSSPPGYFYNSREEAEKALSKESLSTVTIYALWVLQ